MAPSSHPWNRSAMNRKRLGDGWDGCTSWPNGNGDPDCCVLWNCDCATFVQLFSSQHCRENLFEGKAKVNIRAFCLALFIADHRKVRERYDEGETGVNQRQWPAEYSFRAKKVPKVVCLVEDFLRQQTRGREPSPCPPETECLACQGTLWRW